MCFITAHRLLPEVRDHELFEFRGAPRHCTDPVQPDPSGSRAPPSRWDQCSTPSFLVHAVHFVVLRHDVLQLRASDVSSASPAMYTTSHTSLLPSTSTSTSQSISSSLTSRLTLVSYSRVKLNGRLAGISSLLARSFARMRRSNPCDRQLSRTLPAAFV